MRILWVGLLLVACSGGMSGPPRAPTRTGDADQSFHQRVSFDLQGPPWRLSSSTEVSITCHTPVATEMVTRALYSPFYAPMEQIVARRNGDRLPPDQVTRSTSNHDSFLDDDTEYLIRFKHLEVGDTISYRHDQRFRSIEWMPLLLVPNVNRVGRYTVELSHPPGVAVEFDLLFPRQRFAPIIERGETRSRITFHDLPHTLPLEAFELNGIHAVIWLRPRQGERRLTPVTVEQFSRWYASLFGKPRAFDAKQLEAIWRLFQGADTPTEKVRRAYDWTRNNVRYIADERGINGLVPRDPSLVMRRRYGDCKDMAYLVVALAGQAGVEVDPVLVGTKHNLEFDGIHSMMFNHMIAQFEDGGERLFMDPTCGPCEFGNLPEADVERVAVVLGGRQATRVVIPAPPQEPTIELQIDATIADLAHARAHVTLRNNALWKVREMQRRRLPDRTLQSRLSQLVGVNLYKVLLQDFRLQRVTDGAADLVARADLRQFVVRSTRKLYLPRVPFVTRGGALLDRRGDGYPIHLAGRDHLALTITLTAPDHVAASPVPLRLGSSGTAEFFTAMRSLPDGAVEVRYLYQQHRKHFTGQSRAALLELHRRYLRARREMYTMTRRGDDANVAR